MATCSLLYPFLILYRVPAKVGRIPKLNTT
jgi:hypothetical protein